MYENLKKMSIKAKKKLKNANFSWKYVLMELDQGKIISCVPDRILHSNLKPKKSNLKKNFGNDNVSQQKCAIRLKLTGIGIEIWYRYH